VPVNLHQRDYLKELDFSSAEIRFLLDLARDLKRAKKSGTEVRRLEGKNIALVFEKTSTRTRCAFEVGAYDQGAHVTYLDPQSSQMGHKESTADTARVLSRYFDAIEFRGSSHSLVEELAQYADVPVYNGLTDQWHPTQTLADFQTMIEHSNGRAPNQISYSYLGDARNNMGNSLLIMGAILGSDVRIVGPEKLWPSAEVQDQAKRRAAESGAQITLTEDLDEGLRGTDFVHTDVWVSMGEPAQVWQERVELLAPYQVNDTTMRRSQNDHVRFLHCLPAFHDTTTKVGRQIADQTGMSDGLEVTHEVFESAASVVFDQAENRLHTIKAILVATLAN